MTEDEVCQCGHFRSFHDPALHCVRCNCRGYHPQDDGPQRKPDILRRKAGKLRVGLVPPGLDQSVVLVMEAVLMGSSPQKCEDDWFVLLDDPPREVERAFAEAIKRHVLRILAGEEFDSETGLPHLWHILTGGSIANALLYHREDVRALWDRERTFEVKPEVGSDCTPPSTHVGHVALDPAQALPYVESDLQEEPTKAYGGSATLRTGPAAPTWLDTAAGQEAAGTYFKSTVSLTKPQHACLGFPCDVCRNLYNLEAITKEP